jgi:hypothetical protein
MNLQLTDLNFPGLLDMRTSNIGVAPRIAHHTRDAMKHSQGSLRAEEYQPEGADLRSTPGHDTGEIAGSIETLQRLVDLVKIR